MGFAPASGALDGAAAVPHAGSMSLRPTLAAAALAAALLAPSAAPAEELRTLVLPVGATQVVGGYQGMCDDLAVATISLDGAAKVTGVKAGTTICSVQTTGGRQVFRVKVEPQAPAKR